ncbi:MAG: transporter substrate-binding domain-containing protein [Chloroflexota bacterium]
MKKLLVLVSLLVAASLVLTACGSQSKTPEFNSLEDLSGYALCAGTATTYDYWLNNDMEGLGLPASSIYSKAPDGITVVTLETDQECAQALVAGREDFVGYVTSETVVDANIAAGLPVKKLGDPVYSEDLAAAFDKSSTLDTTSLRAEVDKVFAQMHADGTLSALSNQWFKVDLTQSPTGTAFTSSTAAPMDGDLLSAIKERGYLLVSTDPNYEPQSFLNTDGQRPADSKCPADTLTAVEMQGFDVDVAKAVGEALGVETCFATPSWDTITAGNWANKWDLSIGSMTITTERQKILDFSIPYYFTPAVVAVRATAP